MAYAKRYQATWGSTSKGGYVYIYEKDYSGSVESIKLSVNGFSIEYNWDNWDSYVIGITCKFEIVNDKEDYFDLFDLLIATERKYKIVVEKATVPDQLTLFEGFLNVEASEQKYLKWHTITLVASSYLSKLQHIYPSSLDTLQNMTFIDLLQEILAETGSTLNIRANVAVITEEDESGLSAGQTWLNKTGIYTELFWINNIDRKDGLTILNEILKSFNCFLYYWNGYWYIEEFSMFWETSKVYVEYTAGTPYSPTDAGTVLSPETFSVGDVHSLVFTNMSQVIKTIPGNRLLQIRLDLVELLNLVINDFSDATATLVNNPTPNLRKWLYYNSGIIWLSSLAGRKYKTIENSITRAINNPWSYTDYHRGLYTKFEATIQEGAQLSIKFKYGFSSLRVGGSSDVYSGNLEDYTFTFRYYLRVLLEGLPFDYHYVVYDETTEEWVVKGYADGDAGEIAAVQEVVIEGTEFDKDNNICEVSINIPLSSAFVDSTGTGAGDFTFVLCIATETAWKHPGGFYNPAEIAHFGDVNVTISDLQEEDNLIEGEINTDFLNKKEIGLSVCDIANLNYKNGILRGDNLEYRTGEWVIPDSSSITYSLAEVVLYYKWRMLNVTRQVISSNIDLQLLQRLRIFSLFTDSKQSSMKFILMGYIYTPNKDSVEVKLAEYDDSTPVNFIE